MRIRLLHRRGVEQLGSSLGSYPEVVGSNPAPATTHNSMKNLAGGLSTSEIFYLIRSELVTTKSEESAIAPAAYIGCNKPRAAIGKPMTL